MDNDGLIATTEVSMEYAALKNEDHCPKGMYVIPSAESVLIWDAVLFVHQGYYADSILKFQIQFPTDYPSRAPSVTFITDILHPLISQKDGSLNLSVRFPHWRPKQDHIFHVLHWIKVIFKKQTLDNLQEADCFNKEAFKLYNESVNSFSALATQSAMLSQSPSALYDVKKNDTQEALFFETSKGDIDTMRARLGLKSWPISTESGV